MPGLMWNNSRTDVARGFLTSEEYYARVIQDMYATYLNRPADAGGLWHWLAILQQPGTSLETVRAAILSSAEFLILR